MGNGDQPEHLVLDDINAVRMRKRRRGRARWAGGQVGRWAGGEARRGILMRLERGRSGARQSGGFGRRAGCQVALARQTGRQAGRRMNDG